MAYTIVKSNGTVLTTIPDGTINTTSTSLGLPGRNYAGYGQSVDTNFVRITENFANAGPPANPLRGQIWYNTSDATLYVCPTDGESNALAWLALTSTQSGGATTFGTVTVTGIGNVYPIGVEGTGEVGNVTIRISVLVTGVSASGEIGNVTVRGKASVSLTGVSATGFIGNVLVWGIINTDQTPDWTAIPDGQVPGWTPVTDAQAPSWQAITDSQAPNWGQVSDAQTPGWVEIAA